MVRAPCCEKMGLKKGPWTPEEDQVLVAYIQRYGHGNWRALPKQAGLLRCGKSCRLRWTNYLRPDIKRGNFSKEEEETIISLHGMLGNRWSAIAAKLPGRTDNEIKNVWHTHLKKRLKSPHSVVECKRKTKTNAKIKSESKPVASEFSSADTYPRLESQNMAAVSPTQSCSDTWSSSTTDSSLVTGENSNSAINNEWMNSSLEFPEIDESFWTEALGMDDSILPMDSTTTAGTFSGPLIDSSHSFSSSNDEDKDFWLRVFMEAGSLQDLPEIY